MSSRHTPPLDPSPVHLLILITEDKEAGQEGSETLVTSANCPGGPAKPRSLNTSDIVDADAWQLPRWATSGDFGDYLQHYTAFVCILPCAHSSSRWRGAHFIQRYMTILVNQQHFYCDLCARKMIFFHRPIENNGLIRHHK